MNESNINFAESVNEADEETADFTRIYSQKSGCASTMSKSSKSMYMNATASTLARTGQNQKQETVFRAVDNRNNVINTSQQKHQESCRSPKKSFKNYNNITPVLRENLGQNRPSTAQIMKAAGSPQSSPGVKNSFRSSKPGSASKNQDLVGRVSLPGPQRNHETSPLKKQHSAIGQPRKSALPPSSASPLKHNF